MKIRKLVCILMSVVLIFGLTNFTTVFADVNVADDELFVPSDYEFYAPTIRQMIEINLETGNQDEEFYRVLADAYLASPSLLAETISDLEDEEIEYLAKAIAYDLQKTNRTELAFVPEDCEDDVSAAITRLIYAEIYDSTNAILDSFATMPVFEEQIMAEELMAIIDEVTVYSVTPASSQSSVNSTLQITVSFGSGAASLNNRQYVVKLYKKLDGRKFLVSSQSATIFSGSSNGSVNVSVSFANTGQYRFCAEVYDTSGQLLATSQDSSVVTVRGNWRIVVALHEDRDQLGVLYLYDAGGYLRHYCICLGRSVSGAATNVYQGNTPTGECTGYLGGPDSDVVAYGPYKYIVLTPVSGDMYNFDRSGFLIHGGDNEYVTSDISYYPLEPTHGCVRVTNDDQQRLQEKIEGMIEIDHHYSVGNVSIIEAE